MLEGDSGASGVARRMGVAANPPAPLRIQVPAHVAANFEGVVARVPTTMHRRGRPSLEARAHLRRPCDLDRARRAPPRGQRAGRRRVPHRRHSPTSGSCTTSTPTRSRRSTAGPMRLRQRCSTTSVSVLKAERSRAVPERNNPWPYSPRRPTRGPISEQPTTASQSAAHGTPEARASIPTIRDACRVRPGREAGAGGRHQHRGDGHRQADRCVRQRDDGAVLRLPRCRDGRRRRQPARRRDPGRPAVAQTGDPHRRGRSVPRRRRFPRARSPTRWRSATST